MGKRRHYFRTVTSVSSTGCCCSFRCFSMSQLLVSMLLYTVSEHSLFWSFQLKPIHLQMLSLNILTCHTWIASEGFPSHHSLSVPASNLFSCLISVTYQSTVVCQGHKKIPQKVIKSSTVILLGTQSKMIQFIDLSILSIPRRHVENMQTARTTAGTGIEPCTSAL